LAHDALRNNWQAELLRTSDVAHGATWELPTAGEARPRQLATAKSRSPGGQLNVLQLTQMLRSLLHPAVLELGPRQAPCLPADAVVVLTDGTANWAVRAEPASHMGHGM
jgi:hypothetical protein